MTSQINLSVRSSIGFVLGVVEGTRGRGSEIRDINNKMTQDNGMELLYRPTINIFRYAGSIEIQKITFWIASQCTTYVAFFRIKRFS